jgi:hypothetical protein
MAGEESSELAVPFCYPNSLKGLLGIVSSLAQKEF